MVYPSSKCQEDFVDKDSLVADFWAESGSFLPTLGSQVHWITFGDLAIEHMTGCGGWWGEGTTFLCHPLARHMTITVPEPYTGQHPGRRSAGPHSVHHNVISIPYLGA